MATIVPDSERLRAELRELPEEKKRTIRAKRHPWIGPRRMVILRVVSVGGAAVVEELAARHGECWWEGGRWQLRRPQLRLPGF